MGKNTLNLEGGNKPDRLSLTGSRKFEPILLPFIILYLPQKSDRSQDLNLDILGNNIIHLHLPLDEHNFSL